MGATLVSSRFLARGARIKEGEVEGGDKAGRKFKPGITEMNHLNVASASFSAVCFES